MKIYTIGEIILENPKSKIKVKESGNTGKYVFLQVVKKENFIMIFYVMEKIFLLQLEVRHIFLITMVKHPIQQIVTLLKQKLLCIQNFYFIFCNLKLLK